METISPELALVDERLDTAARRSLPDAADCLVPETGPVRSPGTVARESAVRTPRIAPLAGLPIVLLAVAFTLASLPLSSGRDEPAARVAKAPVPKVDKAATSATPKHVRWQSVRNADFYNVIFWRNGTRALDLWPTTASARVPQGTLPKGVYTWFVYPGFETGKTRRYGRVIAQGRLRI